jgi:hypothetical protein
VLVGGVVIEDDTDHLAGRQRPLDGVQKANELLIAVALHAPPDHGALERSTIIGGNLDRNPLAHAGMVQTLHVTGTLMTASMY